MSEPTTIRRVLGLTAATTAAVFFGGALWWYAPATVGVAVVVVGIVITSAIGVMPAGDHATSD